ncbi:MAG: aminoglycoside phosphotransferase family protein [Burkholderiales bacterium]|nr:aminoglycoside phosphotransferase family protein [Burkholderiales bacterium]
MSALEQALREARLIGPDEQCIVSSLEGGVSSDICLVETPARRFCVKRALARLKVAADWRAPIERNHSEVEWMKVVGAIVPGAVPEILADRSAEGWFAMAYLEPTRHPLWKSELRDGRIDLDFAARVGATLVRIHSATAADARLAARFATDHIFGPIRLEPYLAATAAKHADCASRLMALIETTRATKLALVHGDVSPKNILMGPAGPVFLDAECAWWGDPAFDVAFCLNHLLLKGVWRPQWKARYLAAFDALAQAYFSSVNWEAAQALEERVAGLLPGLLLARIDGKSPVEYITEEAERDRVRRLARQFLLQPVSTLAPIRAAWALEGTA